MGLGMRIADSRDCGAVRGFCILGRGGQRKRLKVPLCITAKTGVSHQARAHGVQSVGLIRIGGDTHAYTSILYLTYNTTRPHEILLKILKHHGIWWYVIFIDFIMMKETAKWTRRNLQFPFSTLFCACWPIYANELSMSSNKGLMQPLLKSISDLYSYWVVSKNKSVLDIKLQISNIKQLRLFYRMPQSL